MKRILLLTMAVTAMLAAVIIPLDMSRSRQSTVFERQAGTSSLQSPTNSAVPPASETTERAQSDIGTPEAPVAAAPSDDGLSAFIQEDADFPGGAETYDKQAPSGGDRHPVSSSSASSAAPTPAVSVPAVPGPSASIPSVSSTQTSRPAVSRPASSSSDSQKPTPPSSSRPASAGSASSSPGSSSLSFAEQVVSLVNQERTKAGLQPLSISQPAAAAALVRAREIEDSFSHTRPDGRSFGTALAEQGVKYRSAGENIAWGQQTPQQVMEGWMNSPGHRANILSEKFTSIGVGHYQSASGRHYWTQLFIG